MSRNTSPVKSLKQSKINIKTTNQLLIVAQNLFTQGQYYEAQRYCEEVYEIDATNLENLLLLGAIHYQLHNYSESVFYNQQIVRVDANFAEGYSNLGNALKEMGDLEAAIQFYLKAIKLKPRYSDAYNNLANIYVQQGKLKEALETYQIALVINPGLVDTHSNLGNIYKAMGDVTNSKKCYLEAIRIKPDFAIAWNNLAGIFKDLASKTSATSDGTSTTTSMNNMETAIAYYREAIRLSPLFADAYNNLGNALYFIKQYSEAKQCFNKAIELRPDFALAYGNIGCLQCDLNEISQAIRSLKYAIHLQHIFPDAYNNLGNAYFKFGKEKYDLAIEAYRTCLEQKPDHSHAYNNLGNVLKEKVLLKEAIHCYVTSIRINPLNAHSHCNLGILLRDQHKLSQAMTHYKESIQLDPNFVDGYINIGVSYKQLENYEEALNNFNHALKLDGANWLVYFNIGLTYEDMFNYSLAIINYRKALSINPINNRLFCQLLYCRWLVCDWDNYHVDINRLLQILQEEISKFQVNNVTDLSLSIQPFHAMRCPYISHENMKSIALIHHQQIKTKLSLIANDFQFFYKTKLKTRVIKIGYLSNNFSHNTSCSNLLSIICNHDKSKFDIYCYATKTSDESTNRKFLEMKVGKNFKDLSLLSLMEAAQCIYNDSINVLIYLDGYTNNGICCDIMELCPCPLQISFSQGYLGTLGSNNIQYIVGDDVTIPLNERQNYLQKVISMPHSFFANSHEVVYKDILKEDLPSRSKYNISDDVFVFCNFSSLSKLTVEVFQCWMKILKRVPNSILWLVKYPTNAMKNLQKEAKKHGISESQIVFSNIVPMEEHIRRCHLADLCLDIPFNCCKTSACDVLWSGTPMLTMLGLGDSKMSSRVGGSILRAIGLNQLVVSSLQEYEDTAVTLAQDSNKLYQYRQHIEDCRESSALFDSKRWLRNFEFALEIAWRNKEIGKPANHISVEDNEPIVVKRDNIF